MSANRQTETDFVCPQCGSPTYGSVTSQGQRSTFCEDCVGDREIDDLPTT